MQHGGGFCLVRPKNSLIMAKICLSEKVPNMWKPRQMRERVGIFKLCATFSIELGGRLQPVSASHIRGGELVCVCVPHTYTQKLRNNVCSGFVIMGEAFLGEVENSHIPASWVMKFEHILRFAG